MDLVTTIQSDVNDLRSLGLTDQERKMVDAILKFVLSDDFEKAFLLSVRLNRSLTNKQVISTHLFAGVTDMYNAHELERMKK